jgi:RNA polymerase sigma factor (sigma-70 family)
MATGQLGTLLRHIHKLAASGGGCPRTDSHLLDDFAARRDEAAFATLVARHGPMVLRVCRHVLGHEQDAEDAFQATFLVLARHPGSIRKREALASWLHGAAYRTAMRAKRNAARRCKHEARLRSAASRITNSPTWDDVQTILDEEIQRLPAMYRAAFVLRVLEDKSGPEVAAELAIKEGAVRTRLTRARHLLQQRLARRGVQLGTLLAVLAVAQGAANAGVPAGLADSAVRFGLWAAAGQMAAGTIPAHVAALAAKGSRAMFITKTRGTVAVLLAAAVASAACGLAYSSGSNDDAKAAQQKPAEPLANARPQARSDEKATVAYSGRVLDPDGKPVAGAKLYLTLAWGYPHEPSPSPEFGTTGPDGLFRFQARKAEFGASSTVVAAAAAGFGAGWVEVRADGRRDSLTLRLVKDDVPVTGQIVDLEGKPVAGATLRLMQINAAPDEDLGPWLKATEAGKDLNLQLEQQYLKHFTVAVPLQATTDATGRFRLAGVGRDRLARAQLDGPTIVSQHLLVLTHRGKPFEVTEHEGNPGYGEPRRVTTYYAADFRHAAAPCKPIVGVVRDADTHKPLVGVTIRSMSLTVSPGLRAGFDLVRTTTDAQGRYRLAGMPKRAGNLIAAVPGRDQPYVAANKEVPDSTGLEPVMVDIELKRGVWIEGKLTDKVTGKPVHGSVEYFALYSNPHRRDYPGFDGTILMGELVVGAKADGSYRIVGLPGPGLVGVYYQKEPYLRANARDDEFGTAEDSLRTSPYHISFTSNFNALARIDPAHGAASVKRDIALDPGWTFRDTLLGPDGKPLAGVRKFGTGVREQQEGGPAEFTVRAKH